jgi:vancomycin resistance protein YoaR
VVCLIVVVLLGAYGGLCALAAGDSIFPNVTVDGVNLGGLTCEEAEAALSEAVQAQSPVEDRGVVFTMDTVDGASARVEVPLSSVETDYTATVARAWQIGNDMSAAAKGGVYLKCLLGGEEVLPVYADSDTLDGILDEMDAQIGQEATPSTWTLGETQLTLTKGQPGNALDRDALEEKIFELLGSGEIVDLAGTEPQFTMTLDQTLPEDLDLDDILSQVETEVQDAKFDKAQKLFQVESEGISFDTDEAQSIFDGLDWGESGNVPLIITQPQVTVDDLSGYLYQDVLGTCTTTISGTANRVSNIALAAQYFNGTVLMPGEEFSYNGVVGRRTKERGFLDAPAYVGGETVQETGGGICQGSSTIYLAALRANLEITERYNHGYITRYVPDGMDATVYYGAKDFKFKNDTPFPIKVVGTVSGRTLTVNILGTKSDNITVEMTNEITGTTPYNTVYKVDSSIPAGSTQVSVSPYTGYTVKVYRNLYENGTLISTTLESNNTYKSRDKVVLVSPADAAQYGLSASD